MSEPFSTLGGIATKDEAYRKLQHHLQEGQNQCHVIGHLFNTEDDARSKLMAKGWHGVAEMLKMVEIQVREIMMGKMQ
jgi:hypothetical protein